MKTKYNSLEGEQDKNNSLEGEQMTIAEYYKIARVGDVIKWRDYNETVTRITEDRILSKEKEQDYFWYDRDDKSIRITLIKQAKPDWDNLRVWDVLINEEIEYVVKLVLNDIVFYESCVYKQTHNHWNNKKRLISRGYVINGTNKDKDETPNEYNKRLKGKLNKLVIKDTREDKEEEYMERVAEYMERVAKYTLQGLIDSGVTKKEIE